MDVAALLLTGGASRRMGRDKALLPALLVRSTTPGGSADVAREGTGDGAETLAGRTARLLVAVADPVLEVGGAATGLDRVSDPVPHAGPLVAMAASAATLRARGWAGPVLVVATDLPWLTGGLLRWLAGHPSTAAVVPADRDGRAQPLCARYPWAALEAAEGLVAAGSTRMAELLAVMAVETFPPEQWSGPAGRPDALDDVDHPSDLDRTAIR